MLKVTFLIFALFCGQILASQFATVVAEKAVIYSDKKISSPIGYVPRGKKVKVGNIARNKGRVFPIVVSGKIAYIKTSDVATDMDMLALESATNRAKEAKKSLVAHKFSLHYAYHSTTVTTDDEFDGSSSKTIPLTGIMLKGHMSKLTDHFEFRMGMEYINGTNENESLTMLAFNPEFSYRLGGRGRLDILLVAFPSLIPYAQYELDPLFKINGYGVSFVSGLDINYHFNDTWELHMNLDYEYGKLMGFNVPSEFDVDSYSPTISGARAGLGIAYDY